MTANRLLTAFASVSALALAGCSGGTYNMKDTDTIDPKPVAEQPHYGVPVAGGAVTEVPYSVRGYDYSRGNRSQRQVGTIGLVGSPGVRGVGECFHMSSVYGPPTVDPRNGRLIDPQVEIRIPRRMPCDGYPHFIEYGPARR